MTKIELEEIREICSKEFASAVLELSRNNIKPLDQQYAIGRKHAAIDILRNIDIKFKHLLEATG